ncbi:hypothetical protein [Sulfurimonas sp. HSL-1716]|uniref:hypothetical protein n=1 Tax=Hydrocurvibacter sulfurireducens TaxID=3131937 RepID=UPI0031F8F180
MRFLSKFLFVLIPLALSADSVEQLAADMNLLAGTKATTQWQRIFSSYKKQLQYGINNLNEIEKMRLKEYLIKHAADSDQPVIPGL